MDGKKKKNKKKKGNNQNRVQDDVLPIAEQSVVTEGDDGFVTEVNHVQKSPCVTDVQNAGVSELNSETDRYKVYEDRFVKLQEVIRQLEDEKNQRVQKEVSTEEKIKLLQNVIETCINKEAGLEEMLKEIQKGNNSITEKEAILENKVRHIEGVKDSWILKETFVDEMASRLDEVNLRLQEQVKELKESRDGLVQENVRLKESIAVLEARLERLESETTLTKSSVDIIREKLPVEEIKQSQPEAASPFVEEREQEKALDIEKVKEVHVESDITTHKDDSTAVSSTEIIPSTTSNHDSVADGNRIENFGSISGVMDNNPRISEDVVSVPLDDIQVQEAEPQEEIEADRPIPITDAPLIGAPFRIISFFTKYVSGADLVEKERRRSG